MSRFNGGLAVAGRRRHRRLLLLPHFLPLLLLLFMFLLLLPWLFLLLFWVLLSGAPRHIRRDLVVVDVGVAVIVAPSAVLKEEEKENKNQQYQGCIGTAASVVGRSRRSKLLPSPAHGRLQHEPSILKDQ